VWRRTPLSQELLTFLLSVWVTSAFQLLCYCIAKFALFLRKFSSAPISRTNFWWRQAAGCLCHIAHPLLLTNAGSSPLNLAALACLRYVTFGICLLQEFTSDITHLLVPISNTNRVWVVEVLKSVMLPVHVYSHETNVRSYSSGHALGHSLGHALCPFILLLTGFTLWPWSWTFTVWIRKTN